MTPPALGGSQLEIRRSGATWSGLHTAVRARRLERGRSVFAGVFPELGAGAYEIRVRHGASEHGVVAHVQAGTATQIDFWSD
jgi:hypothetical protein